MKNRIASTIIAKTALGIASSLALLSVGCTTSGAPREAVMCSKCQTVWFKAPAGGSPGTKGGLLELKSAGSMSCPDCRNDVETVFKGMGRVVHSCKSCGGSLSHCRTHH